LRLTPDKNFMFALVLGILMALTTPTLAALGEIRLDVYVSLFTLEYFAAKAILRPRLRVRDPVAITLLFLFLLIVALRVMEVLGVAPLS